MSFAILDMAMAFASTSWFVWQSSIVPVIAPGVQGKESDALTSVGEEGGDHGGPESEESALVAARSRVGSEGEAVLEVAESDAVARGRSAEVDDEQQDDQARHGDDLYEREPELHLAKPLGTAEIERNDQYRYDGDPDTSRKICPVRNHKGCGVDVVGRDDQVLEQIVPPSSNTELVRDEASSVTGETARMRHNRRGSTVCETGTSADDETSAESATDSNHADLTTLEGTVELALLRPLVIGGGRNLLVVSLDGVIAGAGLLLGIRALGADLVRVSHRCENGMGSQRREPVSKINQAVKERQEGGESGAVASVVWVGGCSGGIGRGRKGRGALGYRLFYSLCTGRRGARVIPVSCALPQARLRVVHQWLLGATRDHRSWCWADKLTDWGAKILRSCKFDRREEEDFSFAKTFFLFPHRRWLFRTRRVTARRSVVAVTRIPPTRKPPFATSFPATLFFADRSPIPSLQHLHSTTAFDLSMNALNALE
ncbi:hypothetical protein L1887_47170 [Cichorium endivia]|nr:hypothetical protein L1887_47170 [Cichorium endivia]